jgi:hypothetical protein
LLLSVMAVMGACAPVESGDEAELGAASTTEPEVERFTLRRISEDFAAPYRDDAGFADFRRLVDQADSTCGEDVRCRHEMVSRLVSASPSATACLDDAGQDAKDLAAAEGSTQFIELGCFFEWAMCFIDYCSYAHQVKNGICSWEAIEECMYWHGCGGPSPY